MRDLLQFTESHDYLSNWYLDVKWKSHFKRCWHDWLFVVSCLGVDNIFNMTRFSWANDSTNWLLKFRFDVLYLNKMVPQRVSGRIKFVPAELEKLHLLRIASRTLSGMFQTHFLRSGIDSALWRMGLEDIGYCYNCTFDGLHITPTGARSCTPLFDANHSPTTRMNWPLGGPSLAKLLSNAINRWHLIHNGLYLGMWQDPPSTHTGKVRWAPNGNAYCEWYLLWKWVVWNLCWCFLTDTPVFIPSLNI